jgi:hypothetical protein
MNAIGHPTQQAPPAIVYEACCLSCPTTGAIAGGPRQISKACLLPADRRVHSGDVRAAIRDYLHGVRYALTRPWRATRDVGLHAHVVPSLFGLIAGVWVPIAVLIDGDPLRDMLWSLPLLLLGLANAAYVIHRYRRRNGPELLDTWIAARKGARSPGDET